MSLADWSYRRPITITNNTSQDLTDYQVLIDLTDYTLTGAQSTCADIRFTASDGSTLLNYWKEECEGTSTGQKKLFWVKVPNIPANSSTTIYVYYGNSGAGDASDGDATFLFFNDFSSEIKFTRFPYDISPWGDEDGTSPNTYSLDAGRLKAVQQIAASHVMALVTLPHDNVAIHVQINLDTLEAIEEAGIVARYSVSDTTISDYYARLIYNPSQSRTRIELVKDCHGSAELGSYYSDVSADTWYDLEFRLYESQLRVLWDGVERITVTDTDISSGDELGIMSGYTSGVSHYYDNFFVRKYVSPEPSVSIGVETSLKISYPKELIPKYEELKLWRV